MKVLKSMVSRADREASILAVLAASDGAWLQTGDVILMARGNPQLVLLSLNEMLKAGRVERKGTASYRWRLVEGE